MKYVNKCVIAALAMLAFFMVSILECRATLITPPTVIQLEGGSESNGVWTGGYWQFTVAVDQADEYEGSIILQQNTTGKQDIGTRVFTNRTVEISIKPQRAYYKRTLMQSDISNRYVAPKVYKGGIDYHWLAGLGWFDKNTYADPVVCDHYTFADRAWTRYTVFTVTVSINGTIVGSSTMNTEAGTKTLVVPTPYGDAIFKNVGTFAPDVSEPDVPANPVIFSKDYIYSEEALQFVRYDHGRTARKGVSGMAYYIENTEAFSLYWYGQCRWKQDDIDVNDTPAPFQSPSWTGYDMIDSGRGWKDVSSWPNFIREPVRPVIFPENGSDSLLSYLNRKCSMGNIAQTWLRGYDWKLEYNANGKPSAVIVELPWGAYSGIPVVTCLIPSELADTIVWHPKLSLMRIVDAYWINGSAANASNVIHGQLTVKQFAISESSATISATVSTDKASVSNFPQTITLAFNQTKTIDFWLANLGVANDIEATVNFTVRRTFDDKVTNTTTLKFSLKAPITPTIPNVINRPDQEGKPAQATVPEIGFPWFWLALAIISAVTVCFLGNLVYKSKQTQKIMLAGVLGLGKEAKGIGKEGLRMGKSLWRNSRTVRPLGGCFVGGLIILIAGYGGSFFGALGLGLIAIPGAFLLGGLGALLFAVCLVSIFK